MALWGVLAVGIYTGYRYLSEYLKDPDSGVANTVDAIVAVKNTNLGSEVVLIAADGSVRQAPGATEESIDKEAIFRPDGNRIFFLSNRSGSSFQVHRWNLASDAIQQRSLGSRSITSIYFGPYGATDGSRALITQGGFVLSYDPRLGTTKQILPPADNERSGADVEGGSGSQFEMVYKSLGSSFDKAKWSADHKLIIATMKREDGSEIIIAQQTEPVRGKDGEMRIPQPQAFAAGRKIDFDIDKDGRVIATVMDFRVPDEENPPKELVKDGKLIYPYRHVMYYFDPSSNEGPKMVAASEKDVAAFTNPLLSPDGSEFLVTVGSVDENGNFKARELDRMPFGAGNAGNVQVVIDGPVKSPSWHPSGTRILYIRNESGKNKIFSAGADGSDKRALGADGDFIAAMYSPQTEAPK